MSMPYHKSRLEKNKIKKTPSGPTPSSFPVALPVTCFSGSTIFARSGNCWGTATSRTTMVYMHTVKRVTIQEAKSPLDF